MKVSKISVQDDKQQARPCHSRPLTSRRSSRALLYRPSLWLFTLLVSAMSQSACGYGFASASGLIPKADGRPVQVLTLRNLSSEADAGILLTRSLNEELSTRGGLRGKGAPIYLEGSVELLEFDPVGITWQGVSTWRAHLRATVILKDPSVRDGNQELARHTFQEWDEYLGGADIESTEVSRRMAMSRMFRTLSVKAADALYD